MMQGSLRINLKRLFPPTVLVMILAITLWLSLSVTTLLHVSDPTISMFLLALSTGLFFTLSYGVQRWRDGRLQSHRTKALAGTLDSSHRACLIVSADGKEIYANQGAREFFGPAHAPLEILLKRAGDNQYSLDELKRLAATAMVGGRRRSEIPLAPAGEEVRDWLLVEVRPVGRNGAVAWLAEDISARYVLEATLHRDSENLHDFIDLIPVGCYEASSDGTILSINYRLAEWLGQTASALVGKNLREIFGILPNLEDDHTDLWLIGRKGEKFRATILHSVYGNGGILNSRSVVIRSLMPEQERDRALWQAEHRFHRLFDDAPIGIALVDINGNITAANSSLQNILSVRGDSFVGHSFPHYTAEADEEIGQDILSIRGDSPVGHSFLHYIAEVDEEIGKEALQRVLGQQELDQGELKESRKREGLEIRLKGQKEVTVQLFLSPIIDDGNLTEDAPLGAIIHCMDTTDQRLLELQFAQSQKMQAMGQLAGGIAHDFNNLLTAMIGFCDLLLQRHKPGNPSFSDIMQIQSNANRAASLVRQLLAFSRRQTLQPQFLDITTALADLNTMLRRLLGERTRLKIEHGRQLGFIRVDPGQFDQVIINLAVNAHDAMPNGGVLTIRTSPVVVDSPIQRGTEMMPAGPYILVEISDTGTGIPQENLSRIFEPFFTTKAVGAGTGLGLSTVYGIIRQTDSFIFVVSEEGKGTCFSIYLPQVSPQSLQETRAEKTLASSLLSSDDSSSLSVSSSSPDLFDYTEKKPKDSGNSTGSETILLVEDEDAVRLFGLRALRNKGYVVLEANSAEQALEIISEKKEDIDLMISDVVMPGMDGVTLARQLREEQPNIKIILMSGYSEDMARNSLDPDDGIGFLPKPFTLKDLVGIVKTALEA